MSILRTRRGRDLPRDALEKMVSKWIAGQRTTQATIKGTAHMNVEIAGRPVDFAFRTRRLPGSG